MRVIINADPEDMQDVLSLIMESRPMFDRVPQRLGWGWSLRTAGGKSFFLRQIKGGISASPTRAGEDRG